MQPLKIIFFARKFLLLSELLPKWIGRSSQQNDQCSSLTRKKKNRLSASSSQFSVMLPLKENVTVRNFLKIQISLAWNEKFHRFDFIELRRFIQCSKWNDIIRSLPLPRNVNVAVTFENAVHAVQTILTCSVRHSKNVERFFLFLKHLLSWERHRVLVRRIQMYCFFAETPTFSGDFEKNNYRMIGDVLKQYFFSTLLYIETGRKKLK